MISLNIRIPVLVGLAATTLLSVAVTASETPPWQRVSEAGRRALSPEIAAGPDGSVNVIWLDKGLTADRPPPKPRKPGEHSHLSSTDLYFTRSEDSGKTWREPVRVNAKPGSVWGFAVSKPRIAVGETGTVHIFYPANDRSPVTDLNVIAAHYTRSTDGGKSFETTRKINQPAPTDQRDILKFELGASHSFGTMGMAADGSIHAIWLDARDMEDPEDGAMVYATASRDDGKTFSEDYLISTGDACPCCQMTTAFSKDTMLMGYRKIYDDGRDSTVAMSTDGGRSFNQSARLPFQPWDIDGCPLKPTALGIDGDRVFAAAYTGGEEPPGVYFSQSNDGGRNFSGKIPAHPDAAYSDAPELTVSTDGNIRLVWQAKTTGPRRLFFSESTDHGETFTQPTEISTPSGSSAYPATDVATDGTVFIVWQQEGEEVFVTAIPASGDIAAR